MTRVLHIVESFDGQATEKWLTLLVSDADKAGSEVDWTFYCIEKDAGRFSEQIIKLGCEVICSPYPISRPFKFVKALREAVRVGGYDIVHSHHDLMSGLYFFAIMGLPVRKRIIHLHNTAFGLPTGNRLKALVGKRIFGYICRRAADHIVGVSDSALKSFWNGKRMSAKGLVIHCARDLNSSTIAGSDHVTLRERLAIPASALILLFVGRMTAYKNPEFVLEILEVLRKQHEDVYGIFIGEGDKKSVVSDSANMCGMSDRVKCLGWRNDVREIMDECDVLIFPSIESPMEGLGLSVVEAQAVGLPVVMSLSVPEEAIVIPELVERISLQAGAKTWGEKVMKLAQQRSLRNRDVCENLMKRSSFSPRHSLSGLLNVYHDHAAIDNRSVDDLPNFIVIGSSKCGTTSLYAYLSTHPEIYLPRQKELHYFQDDAASWGTWGRGLSWYSSLFKGASTYLARGECSPGYSHEDQSEIAARKMFETLPGTKIVYMIRNPIKRIRSHYIEEVANGHLSDSISLSDVIAAGPDGFGIESHFFKVIVQTSLYHRQLQRGPRVRRHLPRTGPHRRSDGDRNGLPPAQPVLP